MAVWQWLGVAVTAAVICMVVRTQQPQLAALCALAAGLMLVLSALEGLGDLQSLFARLTAMAGLQQGYMETLLKALGVACAAEAAAQICTDLGESGLAARVEWMGKWGVFTLSAPVLLALLEMILELVP